jgi:hypothetical protein
MSERCIVCGKFIGDKEISNNEIETEFIPDTEFTIEEINYTHKKCKMKKENEPVQFCNFNIAWVGKCKKPAVKNGRCEEHADLVCASCGAPATHSCEETGQFVCGASLCDDCEHTIAGDGTNGNIGFYRTAPLPEGMKEHCKKTEQVNFPWIVISCCKDYPEMQAILDRYKKGELAYADADKQMNDFIVAKNKEEGKE